MLNGTNKTCDFIVQLRRKVRVQLGEPSLRRAATR